jgi:putative hemolysin
MINRKPAHQIILLLALILSISALITSCRTSQETSTPFPENGEEDPFIGIPNPASFYCQEMGYELELRETDSGTEGICIFPNGAECEEWEFLAGGCSIEWTFCQRQGYNIREGDDGMAICSFNDGSTCPEYDFFIGECQGPQ